MRLFPVIFLGLLMVHQGVSQDTDHGQILYPEIEFVIPDGWEGKVINDFYLITNDNLPVSITVLKHLYKNVEGIKQKYEFGFMDTQRNLYRPSGRMRVVSKDIIEAEFKSRIDGEIFSGKMIGIVNTEGAGLIFTAQGPESADWKEIEYVLDQMINSLQYTGPDPAQPVEYWTKYLSNTRLLLHTFEYAYVPTNSTALLQESAPVQFDICGGGSFISYPYRTLSDDDNQVRMVNRSNRIRQGTWSIIMISGDPFLEFVYHEGDYIRSAIERDENHIYLTGTRWIRYVDGDMIPDCY